MRIANTTLPKITHKETVFFNSVNHSRITQMIQAGRDPQLLSRIPASAQNKDYAPCPASLLRVAVGSNGNLYSCTEHKGDERALVGKIAPPERSFSSVWHSIDRVKKQLAFDPKRECASITCDRYGINSTIEAARAGYEKFGCPSIIAHLLQDHDYTSDLFF